MRNNIQADSFNFPDIYTWLSHLLCLFSSHFCISEKKRSFFFFWWFDHWQRSSHFRSWKVLISKYFPFFRIWHEYLYISLSTYGNHDNENEIMLKDDYQTNVYLRINLSWLILEHNMVNFRCPLTSFSLITPS